MTRVKALNYYLIDVYINVKIPLYICETYIYQSLTIFHFRINRHERV